MSTSENIINWTPVIASIVSVVSTVLTAVLTNLANKFLANAKDASAVSVGAAQEASGHAIEVRAMHRELVPAKKV